MKKIRKLKSTGQIRSSLLQNVALCMVLLLSIDRVKGSWNASAYQRRVPSNAAFCCTVIFYDPFSNPQHYSLCGCHNAETPCVKKRD